MCSRAGGGLPGASYPCGLLAKSPSAALSVTDNWRVKVMHPKPGLCQLVMPCGAAAMAQLMCLLLCGIWLITAALGSGGILSAVLAVLQVWGGPRCMQTLLLL